MPKSLFFQKGYFVLIILSCFFLPLVKIASSLLLMSLVVLWVAEWNFKAKWNLLREEKWRKGILGIGLLYIAYLIGLLYTENFKYAGLDLQIKLPLLIFPLIFSTLDKDIFSSTKVKWYLWAFITGCLVFAVMCIARANYLYFYKEAEVSIFYYEYLTWYFHPSYAAMYATLAIVFLFNILLKENSIGRSFLYAFMLIILVGFVTLTNSKAGLFGLILIMVCCSCFWIYKKKQYLRGSLLLIASMLSIAALLWTSPVFRYRFSDMRTTLENTEDINKKSTGSSDSRVLIWRTSIEMIKENFWIGQGTGDVKDQMLNQYLKKGIEGAYNNKYNNHSQLLQTFVTLGVWGFLILIGGILYLLRMGIRYKYFPLILFSLLVVLNFTLESMLEVQAGVMFYGLFAAFLLMTGKVHALEKGL